MKTKLIGLVACLLVLLTVAPAEAAVVNQSAVGKWPGVWESYKSISPVLSPDGSSYRAIMLCSNHKQTMVWVTSVNELGFAKAWQKEFMRLTVFFMMPGSVFMFGVMGFRAWYTNLLLIRAHSTEFQTCLQDYDTVNGQGIITYLWLSGGQTQPVDFKGQPDSTWVDNSWILNSHGTSYVPNPDVWASAGFWHLNPPLD